MAGRDASEGEALQGETDGAGAMRGEVVGYHGGVNVRKVMKVTTLWLFYEGLQVDREGYGWESG